MRVAGSGSRSPGLGSCRALIAPGAVLTATMFEATSAGLMNRFYDAIETGNTLAAKMLLSPTVVVDESGDVA